jgi:hypothetical protein
MAWPKLFLISFSCFATSFATAQHLEPALPQSSWGLIESSFGRAVVDNEGSKFIGGFGYCNYLKFKDFHGHKFSSIGLSLPFRVFVISPQEEVLENYSYSLSCATLFRYTVQARPCKEVLWFFMGTGPEYRRIWDEHEASSGLPLLQQEFGVKILKPGKILLKNMEAGFTTSIPLRKKEWDSRTYFGSFFIRIDAF